LFQINIWKMLHFCFFSLSFSAIILLIELCVITIRIAILVSLLLEDDLVNLISQHFNLRLGTAEQLRHFCCCRALKESSRISKISLQYITSEAKSYIWFSKCKGISKTAVGFFIRQYIIVALVIPFQIRFKNKGFLFSVVRIRSIWLH